MSKLDYCFEQYKSPNVHAIKKRIWYDIILIGSIPHQKFCFYHLPTRGRAGIKLGDAWYVSNVSIIFYCSMLLYYQSWMFYNHFIVILYQFLVLTYWHSAKCQLFFLHVFYIAGNRYQMESKRSETFCGFFWTRRQRLGQGSARGGLRGEHNPPGRAWAPVGCAHPGRLPHRLFAL